MTPRNHAGLIVASTAAVAALFSGAVSAAESAPSSAARAAPTPSDRPPARQLDLRAPEITHLFTSEQLNRIIAATFRSDIEEIEVEGARDRFPTSTPDIWPGIAAPFWAVLNPTQAWRIFAPLPPDQTRGMRQARFNATDEYVLEPAGIPSPPAQ
jgi:hypothetical protein